ncbi:hypothetical protein GCM10010464_00370 [Pseudonocardia yunnanensis]
MPALPGRPDFSQPGGPTSSAPTGSTGLARPSCATQEEGGRGGRRFLRHRLARFGRLADAKSWEGRFEPFLYPCGVSLAAAMAIKPRAAAGCTGSTSPGARPARPGIEVNTHDLRARAPPLGTIRADQALIDEAAKFPRHHAIQSQYAGLRGRKLRSGSPRSSTNSPGACPS